MRVNKIDIKKQISVDYDKVILKIENPFEDFLDNIDIILFPQWNIKELSKKYHVTSLLKNVIKFDYQYLLIQTDHKDLIEVIEHILKEFIAYQIQYPIKYEEQMEVFACEIDKFDDCFVATKAEGTMFRTFTFYYHQDTTEIQQIEHKINRLSEFHEEILIYALNDSIKAKLSLKNSSDTQIFLNQLTKLYSIIFPKYISENMKNIGMKGSVIIQKVDFFIKQDKEQLQRLKIDVSGFNEPVGLVFITYGYQEAYAKMYKFVEKWLQKLSVTIVELDSLECCRKDQLSDYFRTTFQYSHAIALDPATKGNHQTQRILIFNPPKDTHNKHELHHFFKCSSRIITGLQYPDYNFKLLHQYWGEFVNASKLNIKVSNYEDYLLVNCSRGQEIKLREKIKAFLEDHIKQQVKVQQFQDMFQISLFNEVYLRQIQIKSVQFFILNGALYRSNFTKDGDELDKRLREIYQQMKKSLIFVPISRPLPIKKNYFRQERAIQWENTQCLEHQQFKIQKKVTVNIRSFASINTNEEDCIFIVEDLNNCAQLIKILKDQGTLNIDKKIESNPILGFSLRFCSSFNNLTVCRVAIRNDRQTKWVKRLKQTFQELISNHQSSRHIKFMFPQNTQQSIKVLVPIIIDSIRSNCNLRAQCKLKDVTFFTSLKGGNILRSKIMSKLKEVRQKNVSIVRVSELYLSKSQLQKIITYGYYSLKYFEQNETRQASPLNSFIFLSQLKKKKMTPIFLPQITQRPYNMKAEYIVSCFNETGYKIIGKRIEKITANIDRLAKIKSTLKKYFKAIQYFVIFGNIEGTYFCQRLFYTSSQQKHYKSLERVTLDIDNEKINLQKRYNKYEIIQNEFIELKKVQTHPSKVTELMDMMGGIPLF